MTPPVLFLIFNRPDTTARVFEAIRQAKPSRLYVGADGPRKERLGEKERCEEARRIALSVDWPCEVHTLFRDENLGCRLAVSQAITWFFEHEPQGVILEDDCLPHWSFFSYCAELLERYRDEHRIMCISGDNTINAPFPSTASYDFSRYPLIWGWATWSRAWQNYDLDGFAGADRASVIAKLSPDRRIRRNWNSIMDSVANGRIDTWDYQWSFAVWQADGLASVPSVNLVSNIGFGEEATHTTDATHARADEPALRLSGPFRHPPVTANRHLDILIERYIHGMVPKPPLHRRLLRSVRKRFGANTK